MKEKEAKMNIEELDTNTGKQLKKLISEEFLAWQLYTLFVWAADAKEGMQLNGLFSVIAQDELNDHLNRLMSYAKAHGYAVPCTNDEYIKYAGKPCSKLFLTKIKKSKDLTYYIDQAIEAELYAIASYEESLAIESIPDDLYLILLEIMYEEREHLEDLITMKFTAECEYGEPRMILSN